MDILIHVISGLILMKILGGFSWYVIIFSTIPDLIAYTPYIIHRILIKKDLKFRGMDEYPEKGTFFEKLDRLNHSLIFIGFLFMIFYLLKVPWMNYLWFWVLHILLDIFSYGTDKSGGVKLFWPLSDFRIKSRHWSEKPFWIITYVIAGLLLLIVYFLS